jgi:predicted naringenin-chalcone synthase
MEIRRSGVGREVTAIVGLGTAVPPHRVTRGAAADWMSRALAGDDGAVRLARRVIRRSGIDVRHACVPDFSRGGEPLLLGERSPGTSARMDAFREHAPPLAAAACRRALASAGVAPDAITHLVVVTCTGFYAPGPDVDLVHLLGLRPDVERTLVGFMGCYAAFNGLRAGRQAALSRRDAKALVVCVELCSLHFRPDPAPDNVVANALFGDGAAAVVVAADRDGCEPLVRLGPAATRVEPGTGRAMGWEIGDDGFRMRLSSYVPQLVAAPLAEFVAPLRAPETASWCVHPGGRAVLDHVEDALALGPDALASSRGVLRDLGNVSSATLLFVLEREIARLAEGDRGVMLGFGPGLTLEAAAFTRGPRALAVERAPAADAVRG